jgi:hypothetical protein
MSEAESRIFIVDQIDALPGQAGAVREAYLADYAPGARGRGMSLLHEWITPPIAIQEHGARLTFVWTVADVEGWWRMRLGATLDPGIDAFWGRLAPLIAGRERTFHEAAGRHV